MSRKGVDGYLFNEMSESDREKFEEKFVENEELFIEIAERENELADQYVNGKLSGEELSRFELSLASNPARRSKVENAKLLREFVTSERAENRTITIAERSGFLSKLGKMFSFGSPAFQFASIGLILILAFATILLLIENRRLTSLQTELASARQREAELSRQIEAERGATSELTADLSAERERIEKLEFEIAALRGKEDTNSRPLAPDSPTIATLVFSPVLRRGEPMKRVDLAPRVRQVSVVVNLAEEQLAGSTVTVRLNGGRYEVTASVVKDRVSIRLPRNVLTQGRNSLEIRNGDEVLAQHDFYVSITE